jgi:DNA (cytosine-5)-methyltransferase 1
MEQIPVLSLFCGCGGLDWGFHDNPGFRVVRAYDSMKHAVETYNANFSGAEVRDVTELLSPDFALGFVPGLITGGPPCQDFSVAGLKKLGDRANLTLTYVEVVCGPEVLGDFVPANTGRNIS